MAKDCSAAKVGRQNVSSQVSYTLWIAQNVPADPWGKCEELTKRMALAFPELHRIRGHYNCPIDGRLPHWWMLSPNGEVIDPTRNQFSSKGQGRYEPHVGPEPTGTCLCCGALVYDGQTFCSQKCLSEMTAHLEAEEKDSGNGNS